MAHIATVVNSLGRRTGQEGQLAFHKNVFTEL